MIGKLCAFVIALTLVTALNATKPACAADDGMKIVSGHTAVFTRPPRSVPTTKMPDGPLLGNGDVGVVLGGPPEAQVFHIGKNDFWTRTANAAQVISVGRLELDIPQLKGASYRQEQDMARAEVRGMFTAGPLAVHTRSWVDANENLLLTSLQCDGDATIDVSVRPAGAAGHIADNGRSAVIGRELHGGGRWYFDGDIADVTIVNGVLSGKIEQQPRRSEHFDGKTVFREMPVPRMESAVSVAAWIRIASVRKDANYIVSKGEWNQAYSLGLSQGRLRWTVGGDFIETAEPLEIGKWIYVAGTFDGADRRVYVDGQLKAGGAAAAASAIAPAVAGRDFFTRKADNLLGRGREAAVVCRVIGADALDFKLKPGQSVTIATAILSDLDSPEFLSAAKKRVAQLTPEDVERLSNNQRAWWAGFWSRSFIEIPDKEIEKRWYAAMYVMGSCSRPGKTAPGLWGNWVTTDHPAWKGDYHLNYNFQAPYYIVYSANHADLAMPFYQAVCDSVPNGREMARKRGWKGVHFPVGIGPWGLTTTAADWGQRSDAAFAALNFIWHWQYTQDAAWLKQTGYPYLREVAEFWEDYLKFENGRYVIYNDSIHEGSGPDMNPLLSLGLVRTLFKNILAMSQELGVDADRRGKWRDIVEKISEYPLQERDGRTVFRYSEKGMAWCGGNTLGIHHIFPAGAIGLDSDPKLLQICRNTIDVMHRWRDGNGFSSWYPACARVGYDPQTILSRLRAQCDQCSMPNLVLNYGGGGIENVSGFLAINEMMLQSHESVLRLFPCWPKDANARFGNLRAVGAFLVSAQWKDGAVAGAIIVSEKGKECAVQNPWPGKPVRLVRNGQVAETIRPTANDRLAIKTRIGETIELQQEPGQ